MPRLSSKQSAVPSSSAGRPALRISAVSIGLVTPWTQFVKDENGDVKNSYARPDGGESGERAVGHSSDNNDMRGTSNASDYAGGEEVQSLVKHRAERTFVVRDGRWWDTSLADDAEIQDVTFGSDRYRAFVAEAPQARRWLAIGHDIVFRVGCLGIRVSAADREELPEETLLAVSELPTISPAQAWAEPASVESDEPVAWELPDGEVAPVTPDGMDEDPLVKDVGCACGVTTTQAAPGSSFIWMGLFGLLALGSTRRTMRRWPWTASASPACTKSSGPSSSDGPARF